MDYWLIFFLAGVGDPGDVDLALDFFVTEGADLGDVVGEDRAVDAAHHFKSVWAAARVRVFDGGCGALVHRTIAW